MILSKRTTSSTIMSTVLSMHSIADEASVNIRGVILKMMNGVAFPLGGTQYELFSHEGDELGVVSKVDVEYSIRFMRLHGVHVGKMKHMMYDHETKTLVDGGVAFTFGWSGWLNGHP